MNPQNDQGNSEPVGGIINRKSPLYKMFPVPHAVLVNKKFTAYKASIKVLYVYLAKYANQFSYDDGWFWRQSELLVKETGLNIKTIRAAKIQLIKDGFIEFHKGKYDPESGICHPAWYRVRGYEIPDENEQVPLDENDER